MKLIFFLLGIVIAGNAAAEAPKCKLLRIAEWLIRGDHYRPVVEGAINGQKVGILLDTAAVQTLIKRSATTRLGLARDEVEGHPHAESVRIDEFRIGKSVRTNWRVLVAGEHDFSDDLAVILGDDFFQQADIEFDLANNAVRVYQARDCEGVPLAYWTREALEVPIEPGEKIRLTIAINGRPVRAVLDSGAGRSLLAQLQAAELGITPQSPGARAAGCVSGFGKKTVDSWTAQFESFAIGNEVIKNPRLRFADLRQHTGYLEAEMLLGADFLRSHRVLLARSQGKMYFSYAGGTVFPSAAARGCNAP